MWAAFCCLPSLRPTSCLEFLLVVTLQTPHPACLDASMLSQRVRGQCIRHPYFLMGSGKCADTCCPRTAGPGTPDCSATLLWGSATSVWCRALYSRLRVTKTPPSVPLSPPDPFGRSEVHEGIHLINSTPR